MINSNVVFSCNEGIIHCQYIALVQMNIDPIEWLVSHEIQKWRNKESRRNKRGWLASRIAAKEGIIIWAQRNPPHIELSPSDIYIDNGYDGRPFIQLSSNDIVPPQISLSHTSECGWAVIAPNNETPVGGDIEKITSFPTQAVSYFTSQKEIDQWTADISFPDIRVLYTLLWCIKEAAIKSIGNLKTTDGFLPCQILSEPTEANQIGGYSFSFAERVGTGNWITTGDKIKTACYLKKINH